MKDNRVSVLNDETGETITESLEDMILTELMAVGYEIAYNDKYDDLWHKLIRQALAELQKNMTTEEVIKTVVHFKKELAREIHAQIMLPEHFYLNEPEFEVRIVKAVSEILPSGYTKYRQDEIVDYAAPVKASVLKSKVFGGYNKACHTEYTFDSIPEHTLSIVLDDKDNDVIKWLRPATKQFKIWYRESKLYEPDFVAETPDKVYIIEVKNKDEITDEDVILKARAAKKYCEHVNEFTAKQWQYTLLEDTAIKRSSTFAGLLQEAGKHGI